MVNFQRSNLVEAVIGAAIEVHRHLGPGLLESVYEQCLSHELNLTGVRHERQIALPVEYKGVKVDCGFRIDVAVGRELFLELKSVEQLLPVHSAQLLTYLKIAGVRQGLLINFNHPTLTSGIKSLLNPKVG